MKPYRNNRPPSGAEPPYRVCVVGSGTHFLSGISYYTHRLANELAGSYQVSVILMRRLLPARFYPGRDRVGANLAGLRYRPEVAVFNGVDWYWLPGIFKALRFLRQQRPDALVFQWWSGTVLHSYLLLALAARLLKKQIIIEFHEVQDPGEARLPVARAYVGLMARLVLALADGFVVHSEYDRPRLQAHYKLDPRRPVAVIQHGPYDQYQAGTFKTAPGPERPAGSFNLLFFGTIRPYKGLEDLIRAFDRLSPEQVERFHLTIVGETWENWTLPAELIARSPYRERITFVNRYVADEEVAGYFSQANAVVLPYHRSSASGPLHVAMSHGLPVIVTRVGGLSEAIDGYKGAFTVPPQDAGALREALLEVGKWRSQRFADPHSWDRTVEQYGRLFGELAGEGEWSKAVEAGEVVA